MTQATSHDGGAAGLLDPAAPAAVPEGPPQKLRLAAVFGLVAAAIVLLAAAHVTQGTSAVGTGDLLRMLTGDADPLTVDVFVASRLPRVIACVVVGLALGIAGALLQSVARNAMAAPDTLAVNSGAFVAVVAVAAFGVSLPVVSAGGVAFVGGLAAILLVLAISHGGTVAPTRLVLAGSAVTLALQSVAYVLLLLFEQQTTGLFAWGQGTLVQSDLVAVTWMAPIVATGALVSVALAHRLDILVLGDDAATVLGLDVARTRFVAVLVAVLLTAASVTVAGPIGFVGLCAPVAVRLLAPKVRGLHRHLALLPMAGLAGVVVVIGADVLLRAVLGPQKGVEMPAGVVTTVAGGAVLIAVARRMGDSGATRRPPPAQSRRATSLRFGVVTGVASVALVVVLVGGLLLGDTMLLLGDVTNWLTGRSGTVVTFVLDQRFPRVAAAALAGAALAVSGTAVQATCRNPLAEPGLLGITGGAGVGAVASLALLPSAGIWGMMAAAAVGALVAFGAVYGLSWRSGLDTDRLVLVGVGMWASSFSVITFIVVLVNPWDSGLALTWLSGSTYGRTLSMVAPVAVALLVALPLLATMRRELDVLAVDDDTPRVLGIRLERARLTILVTAALLAGTAVCAVGVVGFVGLVAPHAARALVGGRHARVLPVSALFGALLVSVADTVGRTVIAPAQIPAGLVTALIGTPYFVWLLARSRA